jgi:hypothetical protein
MAISYLLRYDVTGSLIALLGIAGRRVGWCVRLAFSRVDGVAGELPPQRAVGREHVCRIAALLEAMLLPQNWAVNRICCVGR